MRFLVHILLLAPCAWFVREIVSGRDFDSARTEALAYIGAFLGSIYLILALIGEIEILRDRVKKARKK